MRQSRRVGLVVHPTRRIDGVLAAIDARASALGLALGQVRAPGQTRRMADAVEAAACDLLLALGGDGTALSALHAGAPTSRPVLGVACGSVGVLTSVGAERVAWALEEVAAERWSPMLLPGLDVACGERQGGVALNDVAIVRQGPGQILGSIAVDGVLYARVAGDGLVVATAIGSSAYTMAAGGPILAPGLDGLVLTPLAPHGGSTPPLVVGLDSSVELTVDPGHGGLRHEIDGRPASFAGDRLSVRPRAAYAKLVRLADEEPRLTGLRRRGLIADGPRVLIRDARGDARPL